MGRNRQTPERKAYVRAFAKAAYEARKAAGVCAYTPGCGNPAQGGFYCEACRETARIKRLARATVKP